MPKPKRVPPVNIDASGNQITQTNNQQAALNQGLSAVNQNTPFGSLSYTLTTDPKTGQLKYVANTQYTPQQQALFDTFQGNQLGMGQTIEQMIGGLFDQYEADPNLIGQAGSLTDQAIDSMDPAWERFMAPERAQRDNELRNQGIMPGTPAYDQQMDRITNQQQLAKGQWLANFQPEAYKMAKDQYQLPLQNVLAMLSSTGAGNVKGSLTDTPGYNANPADIFGLTKLNYEGQIKNMEQQNAYTNALMSAGIGGISSIMGMPVSAFTNPMGDTATLGTAGIGKILGMG